MSAIIIEDKIVHYEVLGRGKPIIFLHGWVGSWRYWIPAMQSASASYRAYAFDLWGYGETAKENLNYSLEEQTELLDQFMNAMGIGKVALVGHGLGAVVALLYASKHAFVVDRAMVISIPVLGKGVADDLDFQDPVGLTERLLNGSASVEAVRGEAGKIDPAAIHTSMEELSYINLMEIARQMTTASLVVQGVRDPLVPNQDLDDFGNLPSMFHQIIFSDAGHFPMLDRPNKFNRLMKDFLDLPSGQSPTQLQLKDEWKRRVR
ncbi:MAG: alpha/beta hydrolase [Anaerolineales bacterium]|nr:alpha/beta hydrolase [Anaerolineales bacterium]